MLPEPQPAPVIPHAEFKAALLLALTLALISGFLAYVMYARGVFASTQRLVLVADDSEGAKVGMDLTFSGFAIGRVRRIELAEDGKARILIDVPREDARWLRTSTGKMFGPARAFSSRTRSRASSNSFSFSRSLSLIILPLISSDWK